MTCPSLTAVLLQNPFENLLSSTPPPAKSYAIPFLGPSDLPVFFLLLEFTPFHNTPNCHQKSYLLPFEDSSGAMGLYLKPFIYDLIIHLPVPSGDAGSTVNIL